MVHQATGGHMPAASLPEATAGRVAAETATQSASLPAIMRLDPYALNERIHYERGGTRYTIDRSGVSIKQVMARSGLPLSLALPAQAFRGVAVRFIEDALGGRRVILELNHRDAALCVALLVAEDLDDIAADWHAWSRILRVPMVMLDESGEAVPVARHMGELIIEEAIARRKRFSALKHRPWFLRRRKTGLPGPVTRLEPHEIIARN